VEIDGARILVTGGGRRLGAAIADDLAAGGARVCITRHASPGGAGHMEVVADLADPAECARAVREAHAGLGGLDAVVHAAASGFVRTSLADVTPALFEEAIGVTLRAAVFVAQAAAPLLADGGAIVLVGDVAGVDGWAGYLPHSVAKGGLRALNRALARSLAPRLRVALLLPGPVLPGEGDDPERLAATVPLGRIGASSDVAAAVRYLLTAPYVTGVELPVDGGRLLG
jgi:pteridine reductase